MGKTVNKVVAMVVAKENTFGFDSYLIYLNVCLWSRIVSKNYKIATKLLHILNYYHFIDINIIVFLTIIAKPIFNF